MIYSSLRLKSISLAKAFQLGKAYRECAELPLYNFIKIVVSGDLKWLTKWGIVFGKVEIWNQIFTEYTELNPDKKEDRSVMIIKALNFNSNKLYIIRTCIRLLEANPDNNPVKDILAGNGYRNVDNLKLLYTQSKHLEVIIRDYQQQLAAIEAEKEKGRDKTLTESDFDNTLVALSKHFGFEINSKSITISKYCALLKQLNQDIKNAPTGTNK
jgi:hypothetical protein